MAGRYTHEQLLRLRESPLVVKPTNLPPSEEWMGQPQDLGRRRAESNVRGSRPDIQTRGSSKTGGNVVLGPPKTSFSSSTFKSASGSQDSQSRSAFGSFASDAARGDYHSRGKLNGEREKAEDGEGRHGKSLQQRRDGGEPWSSGFGDADKSRRKGGTRELDLEHVDSKDSRRQQRHDLRTRDDALDATDGRKNGTGRSGRPSWLRDESTDLQTRDVAQREWRGADRGSRPIHDRDWNRGGKADQEPEWMGSEAVAEDSEQKGFNANDIEQWKASMRAKERDATPNELTEASVPHSRSTSNATANKQKNGAPLMVDSSLDDKFFQFFSGKAGSNIAASGITDGSIASGSKVPVAKSSKFSGFFGPQVASTPSTVNTQPRPSTPNLQDQPAPGADSASEDKAGFQRILAMLAGPQGSAGPPPSRDQTRSSRTPPGDAAALHSSRSPPPILSPRSRRPGGLENLLGMQSPPSSHAQPTNKDADFLLNLLRSKDGEAPNNYKLPDALQRQFQRESSTNEHQPGGHFEDFNAPPGLHGPMVHGHGQAHGRQQHPSMPFGEDDDGRMFPPHFHGMHPPSHHPGLQRPPGMEHMPALPGMQFMSQTLQQRNSGDVGPPPGFHTRPPNAGQFPPGLLSSMGALNVGNDRGGPFGPMGPGPGIGPGPGPAPGMRMHPPPGFGGMGGPPPPGFHHHGGPPEGFGGPPDRMLADMFDRPFGNEGLGAPPGPFRRQE